MTTARKRTDSETLPGHVNVLVGDVVNLQSEECRCNMVNQCRARFVGRSGAVHNTSNQLSPSFILRSCSDDNWALNAKSGRLGVTNQDQQESNNVMAKSKKEVVPAQETAPDKGGLYGFSATSILRRLGKEGVTTARAKAIMAAQKIPAADSTVYIQVAAGRKGDGKRGEPADITKAQLKELLDSAPEPEPAKRGRKPAVSDEPSEKPAAKKGKKAAAVVAPPAPASRKKKAKAEPADAEPADAEPTPKPAE